jgi:hypothetical protein
VCGGLPEAGLYHLGQILIEVGMSITRQSSAA